MIRSAAKNYQDVAVVVSPADYARASLEEMRGAGGELSPGDASGGWRRRRSAPRRPTTAPSARGWRDDGRRVRAQALPPVLDIRAPRS